MDDDDEGLASPSLGRAGLDARLAGLAAVGGGRDARLWAWLDEGADWFSLSLTNEVIDE